MQVVVDSLLTHYKANGKGRDILLLHGWGDTMEGFNSLQTSLTNKYHIVLVDLPGFGKTQAPQNAWGLNDYANFVGNFLQKMGSKPYAIIAHSNGGAVVLRGLANGVLTTEKLVLLASSGIRDRYKGRNKAIRLVTKAGKIATKPLPASLKKRLRHKVYQTVGSDMLVAEHLQESFKKVVTDDVQPDARKITVPTLLIYGQQDKATPISYGERFHELIKTSRLETIANAGHFILQDQPKLVQDYIEEFLR